MYVDVRHQEDMRGVILKFFKQVSGTISQIELKLGRRHWGDMLRNHSVPRLLQDGSHLGTLQTMSHSESYVGLNRNFVASSRFRIAKFIFHSDIQDGHHMAVILKFFKGHLLLSHIQ